MKKSNSTMSQSSTEDRGYVPYDSEFKDIKSGNNKSECELYHDEDNVVNPLVRVKRSGTGITEKWRIYKDDKLVLTIPAVKLSSQEIDYLRGIHGINHLLSAYKCGQLKTVTDLSDILNSVIFE